MPFLNLDTFSALFILSGMAFQRMLPRKAREFMPKDIVLVVGSCVELHVKKTLNAWLLMIYALHGLLH